MGLTETQSGRSQAKGLILLDRDGVLNKIVIDPEHGTIDSPLHPDQVELLPGVPEALLKLNHAGYDLCVVTNQPSAAKGKTTRLNLEATHQRVLELAQAAGARISSSHICFHRQEDQCECRKPKTLLLKNALGQNQGSVETAWMVGDGVTDVQAGAALGIKTAFLGPRKCDGYKILQDLQLTPAFWGKNLVEFVSFLGI